MAEFKGWPAEAIDFYEGLEADNSKTYWTDHKEIYETRVKAPMEALLAELEPEFGEGKIFRPYRDVRFSKDKTPYKTSLSATLAAGGYISLSTGGLGVGSGMWMIENLTSYRKAVDAKKSGEELVAIVATLRTKAIDVGAHGELKRVPPGFDRNHPREELLRAKGLTAWKSWEPGAWLGTKKAKDRIITFLRDTAPLNDWLHKHTS